MPKAQLFITCLADQFYGDTLRNMIKLLETLGVGMEVPIDQTCCGQPLFNNGFAEKTKPVARAFLEKFSKSTVPIVAPSGSCVSMVKHHYIELFPRGTPEHDLALDISSRIYEFTEYLVRVLGVSDVGAIYHHKVTYHASCHSLREMGLRDEAKILLRGVKGLELVALEEEETCCGFGGAFSVTFPEVSGALLGHKTDRIIASGADTVVITESGCLMNIAGGLKKVGSTVKAMHIIDLLSQKEGTA